MCPVPLDCCVESCRKVRILWPPSELTLDLAGVDRIPFVAARSVVDVVERVGRLTHPFEDHPQHLDVAMFAVRSNQIGFADTPARQHRPYGTAVILHTDPVAHGQSLPVQFGPDAAEYVRDLPRNELLHMLPRSIVVRAIRDGCPHAVGPVPGSYQMVARGLGGGIGTGRFVGGVFGEPVRIAEREIAIDLVGGDVVEPEIMPPRRFEQHVGTVDVGAQEWRRVQDGVVVMRFGGEVDYRIDGRQSRLCRDQGLDQFRVADIAVDECHTIIGYASQIRSVAGIREGVQHCDMGIGAFAHHMVHEVRADESRTAGDQQMPRLECVSFVSHITHGMWTAGMGDCHLLLRYGARASGSGSITFEQTGYNILR